MATIRAQKVESGGRTRRQWSAAQRVQIVQESLRIGTVEACRRHRLHPSLLTKWRKQHRSGRMGAQSQAPAAARLLPVWVQRGTRPSGPVAPAVAAAGASRTGSIEVELTNGQRLSIRGAVEATMLRTVLEELARS